MERTHSVRVRCPRCGTSDTNSLDDAVARLRAADATIANFKCPVCELRYEIPTNELERWVESHVSGQATTNAAT